MGDIKNSLNVSSLLAPIYFDIPTKLHAIRENGDVVPLPFSLQGKTWLRKSAEQIRDRLLTVERKEDVAGFLVFAGYIVMLDTVVDQETGSEFLKPTYPIQPEQVSDRLMNYILKWKAACGDLLLQGYRYPSKPEKQPEDGRGSVLEFARRGTGRFNGIPVTFDWDESGKPRLTLRPDTRLEAAVLSCHAARVRNFRFRQCVECGAIYQPKRHRRVLKFCSERCGKNVAQRSYKARKRKESKRRSRKGGK